MVFTYHRRISHIVAMLAIAAGISGCGLKLPLYIAPPYPPKKPPIDRSWTPPDFVKNAPAVAPSEDLFDDTDPTAPLLMDRLPLTPPPIIIE